MRAQKALFDPNRTMFTADAIAAMTIEEYSLYRSQLLAAIGENPMASVIDLDLNEKTCMYCAASFQDVEALEIHEQECVG